MKTCFYTIDKVVLAKRSDSRYLPWVYYIIIKGPKNGKIFCDLFNAERLVNSQYGGIAPDSPAKILLRYAKDNGLIAYKTIDEKDIDDIGVDDYRFILEEDKSIKKKIMRRNNDKLFETVKKSFKM